LGGTKKLSGGGKALFSSKREALGGQEEALPSTRVDTFCLKRSSRSRERSSSIEASGYFLSEKRLSILKKKLFGRGIDAFSGRKDGS